MFCVNCGKEIPDGSHVCMFCGKTVEASSTVTETANKTANATVTENEANAVTEVKADAEAVTDIATEIATEAAIVAENITEAIAETEVVTEIVTDTVEKADTVAETAADITGTDAEVIKESVAENAIPTPQIAPQPMPQPMPAVAPDNAAIQAPKKKGGAGIAVLVIVLLLILCGAGASALFIFNSADYKIKKAVKNNDVATVCDLYSDVNSSEVKKYVQDTMYNYACDLEDKFKSEEIEYDSMKKDLDLLSKNVLKGDKDFKALCSDMDALNTSRENYAAAEKAFKKEDYQTALDAYSLVIKDDSNYKEAQKKIAECEELLIPPIMGKWNYNFDMGDYILSELEADGNGYNIKCPITLCIEFNDDGTGSIFMDEDSVKKGIESAMSDIIDITYDMLEQETGMSRTEIDEYLYEYAGMTLEEMLSDEVNTDELFDSDQLCESFYYEAEDGVIKIKYNNISSSELYFYIEGDYLVITGEDSGSFEKLEEFGIYLPIYFEKE